ncbi:MAG: hypothetical protein ACLQVI_24105 [Polyangiaceae bacterium]|jgi:hypothetical protein
MKQILFFATGNDLLPVLEEVERVGPLHYARMGQFPKPEPETFSRGGELPRLGQATAESAISSEAYLVSEVAMQVHVRRIEGPGGAERFAVDQLANPDTVTLTPAGVWRGNVILHGRVATVSESPQSQALMRRFKRALEGRFTKVKAFWVGANALALLDAGKRLTIGAQSAPEFDLTR